MHPANVIFAILNFGRFLGRFCQKNEVKMSFNAIVQDKRVKRGSTTSKNNPAGIALY
jgi:hypothetical protein